jgi:hypothetical protein
VFTQILLALKAFKNDTNFPNYFQTELVKKLTAMVSSTNLLQHIVFTYATFLIIGLKHTGRELFPSWRSGQFQMSGYAMKVVYFNNPPNVIVYDDHIGGFDVPVIKKVAQHRDIELR